MKIFLYNLSPEVIATFGADRLMSVATLMKTSAGSIVDTNILSGASLFNNKGFTPANGGYILLDGKTQVAFIEPTDQGCKYRWYNNPDKTKATMTRLLVDGDPEFDLYNANPAVDITAQDGIVKISNITELNNMSWDLTATNRTLKIKGFRWAISGLTGATYGTLEYIGQAKGFNQLGGGRRGFVQITKRTDLPMSTDFVGNSQPNAVDFVYNQSEINDPNMEFLSLQFVYQVKNESEVLRIPLSTIFNS